MSRMFMALLLGLLSVSTVAEVYRWVDEHGVVHFSEKVAAENEKAEVVSTHLHNTYEANTVKQKLPANSWQQQEQKNKEERIKRAQAEDKRLKTEHKQAKQCDGARSRLRDFELRSYTDTSLEALQKRRQQKERLQARIKQYC